MLTLRTFSARRYRIDGRLGSPHDEAFHKRLLDRRFLPLTALEEQTHGWVTADNLLLTRFDEDTVVRADHAVFALRIDRRRVNPLLLRAQLDLELRGRRKAAEDAGRRWHLSREERLQIRADLRENLLRDTNPTVQLCNVVLHTKRRVLYALHLGRAVNETLAKLFADTFGAGLSPLTPWNRGREILAAVQASSASASVSVFTRPLGGLERTAFTGPRAASLPERPLSALESGVRAEEGR